MSSSLSGLSIKGCFGTLHEKFLASARYQVVKNKKALHKEPLDFSAARTLKRNAEAEAGVSEGDRQSPFAIELLNRDVVYAQVGIK